MGDQVKESWGVGDAYEQYVGRWSRQVAPEFLRWIAPPQKAMWSDIGCGTGALTESILALCEPLSVVGIDRSAGFVSAAQRNTSDPRAQFESGDATALPWKSARFEVSVSGLVLNFVPNHQAMTAEMVRVTKAGGIVAAYVWDYAGGMEMMRHFWDAALAVSPQDAKLDQAERFPICQPEPLVTLFTNAGLKSVSVRAIEIPTVFGDFEDYWTPFLGKQGAAPTYLASLADEARDRIRDILRRRLSTNKEGAIQLSARAWAVQGIV
jgi:trans-aconitate methyltransferase